MVDIGRPQDPHEVRIAHPKCFTDKAGERDSPHLTVLIFADDESKFGYGECKSFAIDFLAKFRTTFQDPTAWNRENCQSFDKIADGLILKAFDKYCGQMNAILESVERNKEQIIASIESSVIRHDGIKDIEKGSETLKEGSVTFKAAAKAIHEKALWDLWKWRMIWLCLCGIFLAMVGGSVYQFVPNLQTANSL